MNNNEGETKMDDNNKKIIEINGIKMEVDLRHARAIESFKVGDRVKCLVKSSSYSSEYATRYGVIIDFNEFQTLPTIVVAYIENNYSDFDVKIVNVNSQSKDAAQIVPMDKLEIGISRTDLEQTVARQLDAKKLELRKLEEKQAYVMQVFKNHFEMRVT